MCHDFVTPRVKRPYTRVMSAAIVELVLELRLIESAPTHSSQDAQNPEQDEQVQHSNQVEEAA